MKLLLVLALLAGPVSAQWPPPDWWHTSPNILENPPTAHLLGGGAWDLFARGPWIARSFRNQSWKREALVALGGFVWEAYQVKEINAYPWKRAAWDWEATMVGSLITEGLIHLKEKL